MPATATPSIELIQGPATSGGAGPDSRRSLRLRVFLITFSLLFLIGQVVNFLRPAVYRATVSLLTVEPQGVDQRSAEADVEHVSIQSRLLLGADILQRVLAGVADAGFTRVPDVTELETMLEVRSVADTNLVELRAVGDDPALLTVLVNGWADAYVERRAERVAEATDRTTLELRAQQEALQEKVADKQNDIALYRQRYQIVSGERGENQVLARQKGLNDSLNKALELQAQTQARLNSLRQAVREGRALVPKEESRTLAALEQELQKRQSQWAVLNQRYTAAYLARDPAYKRIPDEMEELAQKIGDIKGAGKRNILNQATQEHEAATEAVETLKRQMIEHKTLAAEFSTRLIQFENLQDELARLQELQKENSQRLAEIEIKNRREFPPLQIVDYGALPRNPIHPLYWRDAGIVFVLSLAAALFMAWLVDYLTGRNRREPSPLTTTGVRVYANEPPAALDAESPPGPELAHKPAATRLQQTLSRELESAELKALIAAAPDDIGAAIGLLLSGVSMAELDGLLSEDYDPASGRLMLRGSGERVLQLGPAPRRWLEDTGVLDRLCGHSGEEIRAGVSVAAVDAGLSDPASVTPEAVQHSYLLHLVRQGARLGELSQLVGPVSAVHLQKYGRYSPPGSNRPLVEIETVHPALAV